MGKIQKLVVNVDDCVDRFWSEDLNCHEHFMQKCAVCFPRFKRLQQNKGELHWSLIFKYMTACMAACHHPKARAFVYAMNFQDPTAQNCEPLTYAEDRKGETLDKIGKADNPNYRKFALGGEIRKYFPNLQYNHTFALFPLRDEGSALHLENAILESLPKEDHERGEWYHSSLGVWKTIVRWHVACFGYDKPQVSDVKIKVIAPDPLCALQQKLDNVQAKIDAINEECDTPVASVVALLKKLENAKTAIIKQIEILSVP